MNVSVKFNNEDEKNCIINYNKNVLKNKIGNTKLDKEVSDKYDCFYVTKDNRVLVMGMSSTRNCVSFEEFKRLINIKPIQLVKASSKVTLNIFKYIRLHKGWNKYISPTIGNLKEINIDLECEYEMPKFEDFLNYCKINSVSDIIENEFEFLESITHNTYTSDWYNYYDFTKLCILKSNTNYHFTLHEIYQTLFALKHAMPKHDFKLGDEIIVIDSDTIKYVKSIDKYMINMTDGTRYYSFEIKNSDRVRVVV